jgi:hypothetical protein
MPPQDVVPPPVEAEEEPDEDEEDEDEDDDDDDSPSSPESPHAESAAKNARNRPARMDDVFMEAPLSWNEELEGIAVKPVPKSNEVVPGCTPNGAPCPRYVPQGLTGIRSFGSKRGENMDTPHGKARRYPRPRHGPSARSCRRYAEEMRIRRGVKVALPGDAMECAHSPRRRGRLLA